jgi:predicted phosphodiesterase
VGFLSDAHGNPLGVEACLRALEGQDVERLYFLGDAVGYFPEENTVLDLLRSAGAHCLRGNHEAYLLGDLPVPADREPVYRTSEARARLRPSHLDWIRQWPDRLEITLNDVRFLLTHGTPDRPLEGYVYPGDDLTPFRGLGVDFALMGHTHRPFVARVGSVTTVNVGSSGMPRDIGDLASCAIVDTATREAGVLRVPFNAPALIARWEGHIHPSATACLRRTGATGVATSNTDS